MAWATGAVVVADVDRDGHADIVGAASGGAQEGFGDLAVSFGDGSGVFGDALQLFTGHSYQDLVPADLDGDSDIDLVGNSGYDGSTVLLNDGTGIFTASSVPGDFVWTYPESVAIALGDVTGDQLADIAVAHATGSDVGVHAGFGDGTFAKHQVRYGLQARVTDLELADMNGDGALDLVSSASTGGAERLVDGGRDTTGAGSIDVLINHEPACTITGPPGPDVLVGTDGSVVICGLGGDDVIKGMGGGRHPARECGTRPARGRAGHRRPHGRGGR
jgi:hypothetical protein